MDINEIIDKYECIESDELKLEYLNEIEEKFNNGFESYENINYLEFILFRDDKKIDLLKNIYNKKNKKIHIIKLKDISSIEKTYYIEANTEDEAKIKMQNNDFISLDNNEWSFKTIISEIKKII